MTILFRLLVLAAVLAGTAWATEPPGRDVPGLTLQVISLPVPAIPGARPGCDPLDIPDTPARAIRLRTGEVQLYASHFKNRVERGEGLLTLKHDCRVVLSGGEQDEPAAYDDRAWIVSPWTDGTTIWAIVHDEFQGHRRPSLCPSGRYMDCWYNTLTAAVSTDGGRSFVPKLGRGPGHRPARALVAALPYRYDQVGLGHHGYFNPSTIVTLDGAQYVMAFATHTLLQREGNCLLRTTGIDDPAAWRAWDGAAFRVTFIDPYSAPQAPEGHVCAPVGAGRLRWPVTSLVRHQASGLFIATMLDGARGGGVFYATSPDLIRWSEPAKMMDGAGLEGFDCADAPPIAYPSVLDARSADPNFATVADDALLFFVRFTVLDCRTGMDRELVRARVRISLP